MHRYEPYYYEYAGKSDWSTFPRREILEYLNVFSGKVADILEVGCGTGEILGFIRPVFRYVGVERSEYARNEARKKWKEKSKAEFVVSDAADLPLAESRFDIALLIFTLEHVHDPRQTLLELRRVLRIGGKLVIAAPNLEFPLAWPNALRHKSFTYRIYFILLRFFDYIFRIFGRYSFRTIPQNFVEYTGRYEKKDDDLRYVVSAWEAINFLERNGFKLEKFWEEKELSGWRKFIRFLPAMRWYGVPLVAAFSRVS